MGTPIPLPVSARELLAGLPAYRNQVVGHGSTRSPEFYEKAGRVLIEGLEKAWEAGAFLRGEERVVYLEAVEIDAEGRRRGRVLDLTGETGHVLDPRGTDIPEGVLPRRVYLKAGNEYRSLHPWVLCEEAEARERVWLFSSLTHRARYLDYASGETLSGEALEAAFPGTEKEAFALFEREPEAAPAPEPDSPDKFGDYRILRKLGEGGMGVVYLARQESLGRLVALKTLPPGLSEDPVAVARFEREVGALSRCEHPNVVKILASGVARGTRYYAMEYVEGADLSRVAGALKENRDLTSAVASAWEGLRKERGEIEGLPEHPPLPAARGRGEVEQVAIAFRDAARALHHLHEQGIVHRDVKPANLMLTASERRVVLMDLGLAAVTGASRSITRDKGQVLGTLRYMAPEQLQRNLLSVDRRADIYSLGATFFELLTGRPLLDGDTEARLIEQILREDPPVARKVSPGVPVDLSTIVRKATEKDPRLRYETAEDLARDLEAFVEGRPISARPPTIRYLLGLAIRRNKALSATIGASALVIVAGTLWFVARLDEKRREAEAERNEKSAALIEVERERDAKAKALDEVLRLSDSKRVRDLVAEAEGLWPLSPERAPAMEDWLVRARQASKGREGHRETLDRLRASALPYDAAAEARDHAADREAYDAARSRRREVQREIRDLAGPEGESKRGALEEEEKRLDAEVSRLSEGMKARKTWEFADPNDAWRHQVLSDLLLDLDRLAAATAEVAKRHEFASTVRRRTVEEHAQAWTEAIEGIAASPRYGGLDISPQVGLVPLGPDPDTGLFEFAHPGSGTMPERDPGTKRLRFTDDSAVVLVLIPGGTFWMGSQRTDPAAPNFDPQARPDEVPHRVTLSPYFLGKHECTQAQWSRMTGTTPSRYRVGRTVGDRPITLRNPVEQVSWGDGTTWLTRWGLSLPTEAQWEYGCRAGTSTPWWPGSEVRGLGGAGNIADAYLKGHGGDSLAVTPEVEDGHSVHAPVGTYRANGLGLYDTLGNVWEWCADEYGPYESREVTDPVGGQGSGVRVSRGGGWNNPARLARSAYRPWFAPGSRDSGLGVRPARSVTP